MTMGYRAARYVPPPKLTVSEWADQYRYLSSVDGSEPGKWRTSRAPYLKGIMDAFTDPDVEGVVVMSSCQIGKTQCLNNVVGFHIHQDPSSILVVQPSQNDAEEWSKDRFMRGMVEVTPALRDLVPAERKKGANQTIVHKEFPSGQLTVAWSNSPSRLASRPIRICLMDEVDKYSVDPGPQGDPVQRAINRTKRFWNRKWGMWSTPTWKGISAIEKAYLHSDQRRFYVNCPHCKEAFVIDFFKNIKWDKGANGAHLPETTHCVCLMCGAVIEERDKAGMVETGQWVPDNPGGNVAGFHINELYTTLGASTWAGVVRKFLAAKDHASSLQNFYNETLGLTWELQGETVEHSTLFERREAYSAMVPMLALVLTAGVDVQRNRILVKVKGWAENEESWDVLWLEIPGDPTTDEPWKELDTILTGEFEHESGARLKIAATLVDSGDQTELVYKYCRARWQHHIYACKGRANSPGNPLPILGTPHELGNGVRLYVVGVDTAKALIYQRLRLETPQAGYYHFPVGDEWGEEYFAQLAAEKLIVKHKDFRPRLSWVKTRDRNEALDCDVYSLAALRVRRIAWGQVRRNLQECATKLLGEHSPSLSVRT